MTLECLRLARQLDEYTASFANSVVSPVAHQVRVKTSDKNQATKGHQVTRACDTDISFKKAFVKFKTPSTWSRCARPTMNLGSCIIHSSTVSVAASSNYFDVNITSASGIMASNSRPAKTLQAICDTCIDQPHEPCTNLKNTLKVTRGATSRLARKKLGRHQKIRERTRTAEHSRHFSFRLA